MDPAARRRQRRAVLDDARRKVERSLSVVRPAEELADAAAKLLEAVEARALRADDPAVTRVSAALTRYRAASGRSPKG